MRAEENCPSELNMSAKKKVKSRFTHQRLFLIFKNRDNPLFNRKEGDLGSIVQAKFLANTRHVILGRFLADK